MTIDFPPFVVDPIRPRAVGRRLVAMACMLALVLLGLAIPGHSHALELTSPQVAIAANDGGDHCPGRTHALGPGHCCASVHGHACCSLLEATGNIVAALAKQARGQPCEPCFAEVVTAPLLRPPAFLAA